MRSQQIIYSGLGNSGVSKTDINIKTNWTDGLNPIWVNLSSMMCTADKNMP